MSKEYLLVGHPLPEDIARQIFGDENDKESYGKYTGQIPGESIVDPNIRNVDEVYKTILIIPDKIERARGRMGSVMITGYTNDSETAQVFIDPLVDINSLGTIVVGEHIR
jgi:hypothetical protein